MANEETATGRPPGAIPPIELPGLSGLLALSVGVVTVAGLYLGRTLLIPIALAVLLSFLLAPLVNLLRRVHCGRVLSVVMAAFLAISIMLAVGGLLGAQIAELAQDIPAYLYTIHTKVRTVQGLMVTQLNMVMPSLSQQYGQASTLQPRSGGDLAVPSALSEQGPLPVEVHQPDPTTIELAKRIIVPIAAPLSATAIVLVITVFVLLQREDLRDRLIRLFGSSDLPLTTVAMNDAARRLSRYFLAQLAVNIAFGVITGMGLSIIGVPNPLLWSILGMLLRFVPYIGVPLAAALPVTLALSADPGWSMMLWTTALYVVVELSLGQAVEPLLDGHSTGLSPFSAVVSAAFWTWLWGPIGLVLSTPLTLCLVVLGRHVEQLEFLDVMLGNRPALTPAQSFYQRMLSGDPDEAREQAEQILQDRPLSSYYDEVALKGLQLAANDAARGALTEVQLERIRTAFYNLTDDLDDDNIQEADTNQPLEDATARPRRERDKPRHPAPDKVARDVQAPERQAMASVLCIAGRGPLDESVARMLAQSLKNNNLEARVLPHAVVSRARIGALDGKGVAIICLCYLDLRGNSSHLRYMLRRLRQRLPAARLLVGFGSMEQLIPTDDTLCGAMAADVYTSSLRKTVDVCVEAIRTENFPCEG